MRDHDYEGDYDLADLLDDARERALSEAIGACYDVEGELLELGRTDAALICARIVERIQGLE